MSWRADGQTRLFDPRWALTFGFNDKNHHQHSHIVTHDRPKAASHPQRDLCPRCSRSAHPPRQPMFSLSLLNTVSSLSAIGSANGGAASHLASLLAAGLAGSGR